MEIDIDYDVLSKRMPDKSLDTWPSIVLAYQDTTQKQAQALAALTRVQSAFQAKPYPISGVGFGNVINLDWPNFGKSFTIGRPVIDLIAEALPVTLLLNVVAIPFIYFIAVPFGMQAAAQQNKLFDKVSGTIFVMFWSIPVVWAGVLAIGFLADNEYLGWFPASGLHSNGSDDMLYMPNWRGGEFHAGYLLDLLWHLVLPVMCLVYGGFAVLAKQTRAAMLDNYTMDFRSHRPCEGCLRQRSEVVPRLPQQSASHHHDLRAGLSRDACRVCRDRTNLLHSRNGFSDHSGDLQSRQGCDSRQRLHDRRGEPCGASPCRHPLRRGRSTRSATIEPSAPEMTQEEKKTEKTISGIDVMRGVGVQRARPFWADAWHRVVIRRGAQVGLIWIAIVGFFALFAPVIANGLPLWSVERSV